MAFTFEELLNKPLDEIKPPPQMPVGSYLVQVVGVPENILSTQKQTPGIRFRYKFFQARPDVDRDVLAAALDEAGQTLTDVEMTDDFYVTERSAFMTKQFLTDVLALPGGTLKEQLSNAPGQQLIIHIRHRPRSDGTGLYAEIDSRSKAE